MDTLTFCYRGKKYELTKKTIKTTHKILEIGKLSEQLNQNIIAIEEYVKKALEFVKYVIGERNTLEILETDDINEIDVNELTIVILNILAAYRKPIDDEVMRENREKLNSEEFKTMLDVLSSIQAAKELESSWIND